MKKVEDLTVDELREIVGAVQEILYLDITYSKGPGEDIEMWNQNKEWEIENLEAIAFQLRGERGTNENTNGLIRQYLPKGINLGRITQRQCVRIAERLNNRPRLRLGFQTPNELYY